MSIHLIFATNSVRNTSITCDSLGIHYEVSDSQGIFTIKRLYSSSNWNGNRGSQSADNQGQFVLDALQAVSQAEGTGSALGHWIKILGRY